MNSLNMDGPSSGLPYASEKNAEPTTTDWDKLKEKGIDISESDCKDSCSSPPVESIAVPRPEFESHHFNGTPSKKFKTEPGNEKHDFANFLSCSKTEVDDDCSAFARHVTIQLRQMTSVQKLFAQRLISEVCFQGQMQCLQIGTTLTGQTTSTLLQQHIPQQQHTPQQTVNAITLKKVPIRRGADSLVRLEHVQRGNLVVPSYYNLQSVPNPQSNHAQSNHPYVTPIADARTALDDFV